MNILTTAEALQAINGRLQRPISKSLFFQSILPLMLKRGDARRVGAAVVIVDGAWIHTWANYIAWRQQQIAERRLPPKHPYSIQEMEELYHAANI